METLIYSNYYTPKVSKSKLIKDLEVTDYDGGTLICPKCSAKHKNIPHGDQMCCFCGLNMQRYGNALQIS